MVADVVVRIDITKLVCLASPLTYRVKRTGLIYEFVASLGEMLRTPVGAPKTTLPDLGSRLDGLQPQSEVYPWSGVRWGGLYGY
jgi:hypothetical protein